MSREWKPGDLAIVEYCGGERLGLRGDGGWMLVTQEGGWLWVADAKPSIVTPIRPLLVLDPEDREQIETLVRIYSDTPDDGTPMRGMQEAVRQMADPTPQIEEPTGLGAVVLLADGSSASCADPGTGAPWVLLIGGDCNWRDWPTLAKIGVTKVLSEGVSGLGRRAR